MGRAAHICECVEMAGMHEITSLPCVRFHISNMNPIIRCGNWFSLDALVVFASQPTADPFLFVSWFRLLIGKINDIFVVSTAHCECIQYNSTYAELQTLRSTFE